MKTNNTDGLAYAYGGPLFTGSIKALPEHFRVVEQLGFEPAGEGEHVYLDIEKRGLTTLAVRDRIAALAGCKPMDVGYGGLKDKWAVTRQWFSVYLPGEAERDWQQLSEPLENPQSNIAVHNVLRHQRKLRRGAHKANHFELLVGELNAPAQQSGELLDRLQRLQQHGMPNYFGEQRFGRDNLAKARALLVGNKRMPREQRSLCLSAARSHLFNRLLSERVARGSWCNYLDGDVLNLNGSRSLFTLSAGEAERDSIIERLARGDIHIAGPLWGSGESQVSGAAAELEHAVLAEEQSLCDGLVQQRVEQSRRAMRALPEQLSWSIESDKLRLSFVLPTGSYATMLVRELVNFSG